MCSGLGARSWVSWRETATVFLWTLALYLMDQYFPLHRGCQHLIIGNLDHLMNFHVVQFFFVRQLINHVEFNCVFQPCTSRLYSFWLFLRRTMSTQHLSRMITLQTNTSGKQSRVRIAGGNLDTESCDVPSGYVAGPVLFLLLHCVNSGVVAQASWYFRTVLWSIRHPVSLSRYQSSVCCAVHVTWVCSQ